MANGDNYDTWDFGSTTSSDEGSFTTADGGGDLADTSGGDTFNYGDLASLGRFVPVSLSDGGPRFQQTAGSLGGIAAGAGALVVTLGGRLAAMFGRGAGSAVINGVKFSMARLWPYIRRYGPGAVAGALGISLAQLGALALQAPMHPNKRRRGISARDISTTSRVLRFNARLNRRFGQGRGGSRRYYRPRRRAYC